MSPFRDAAIAAGLAIAQAALAAPLFAGPFTKWRQSIEAAFIADARFILERFPALSWNPLWYLGFPFEFFYTPLLPAIVALVAPVLGGAPSAYRVVAATGYALGVAGLYLLARRLGVERATAVLAAALFACVPSASLILPGLFGDAAVFTGGPLPLPWRLAALVEYGEGPHVLGLSLLLFATAALHAYLARGEARRFWLAVALFVAVALTNLIALLGAMIFAAGCALAVRAPRQWLERALRVGGMAALLSLAWYSPGFVRAVVGFSTPGGEGGGAAFLFLPIIAAVAAFVSRRLRAQPPALPALAFVAIVCVAILLAWYVARVPLAPQPIRYALELDAATSVLAALGVAALARRALAARATLATAGLALAVVVAALPSWSAVRTSIEPDANWQSWSERAVALWLKSHLVPGERAYLSGDHAFWAGAFADVPQVRGGVDFAGTDPWWAHATYQINTGSDPDTSVLWLRALGVRYAVVSGPESTDAYRDFAKPEMFEGKLRLAAGIRGERIYAVERVHSRPVLASFDAPPAPRDALDRAALQLYLTWLEATPAGASANIVARGDAAWEGEIVVPSGGVQLALPIAYDEGWHAYLDDLDHAHYADLPVRAHADPVGLLAVRVPAGHFRVRVEHRLHTDHLISLALALGALSVIGLAWALHRGLSPHVVALAAVGAAVASYAVALGVVGGFPKGTDALMHLTRLRFVADWFPHHNWLYAWSAGMPAFTTYPALPYLAALPFVRLFGAEATLEGMAFLAMLALGLGLYGHLRERGCSIAISAIAALMALTSLATWQWIVQAGVYARIVALGLAAMAWWSHGRALRAGGARWWAATIVLVAASVSSHPAMGGLAALYLAGCHLAARGRRGVPRLALLAGVAFLLAAPSVLTAMLEGRGGRFLGFQNPSLPALDPSTLVRPDWVGVAAFLVPGALALAYLSRAPARAAAATTLLALPLLYGFAPALGLPSSLYYLRGIDPATMPFVVALAGALAFGALAPEAKDWRGKGATALAAALVALNAIVGIPSFVGPPVDPTVVDTASPFAPEELARVSVPIDGNDLRHRVLPLTADESVGFSYRYRKPMLRDYYDIGQAQPDWLAWAFTTVYAERPDAAQVRAVAEWFAIDTITVPVRAKAGVGETPGLRRIDLAASSPYRAYAVPDPTTIVATTRAPLTVVVADAAGYDRAMRLLARAGSTPRTRLPVWWNGTLADLPADLARTARAVLVVGDRVGDQSRAAGVLERFGSREVEVVWDLGDVPPGAVGEPWPNVGVVQVDITTWDVRDRSGRISGEAFSPARYGEGAWRATVPSELRGGAVSELAIGNAPLVASRALGQARLTVVGGNLFYHALTNANGRETSYLDSFLGPDAIDAEREPKWRFVNPDVREVESDDAPIVLRESFHPGWHARFRGTDGAWRDLPIYQTGPGLMGMLPPGAGTVRLEFRPSLAEITAWLLFVLGVAALLALLRRGHLSG